MNGFFVKKESHRKDPSQKLGRVNDLERFVGALTIKATLLNEIYIYFEITYLFFIILS